MTKLSNYKITFFVGLLIICLQVAILYNFIRYQSTEQNTIQIINKNSNYVVGINVKQIKRQNN